MTVTPFCLTANFICSNKELKSHTFCFYCLLLSERVAASFVLFYVFCCTQKCSLAELKWWCVIYFRCCTHNERSQFFIIFAVKWMCANIRWLKITHARTRTYTDHTVQNWIRWWFITFRRIVHFFYFTSDCCVLMLSFETKSKRNK